MQCQMRSLLLKDDYVVVEVCSLRVAFQQPSRFVARNANRGVLLVVSQHQVQRQAEGRQPLKRGVAETKLVAMVDLLLQWTLFVLLETTAETERSRLFPVQNQLC